MAKQYTVVVYEDSGNNPGIVFCFKSLIDAAGFMDTCLSTYQNKAEDTLYATMKLNDDTEETGE